MNLVGILLDASTSAAGAMRSPGALGIILVGSTLSFANTTNARVAPSSWGTPSLPLSQTSSGLQAPSPRSASAALLELRRISGLTWDQLARLFGVDRRSLHFWASGKPLNSSNEEKLQRLLATIRRLDRGSASENRSLVMQPQPNGLIPFDLLVEGRLEQALALIGTLPSISRPRIAPRAVRVSPAHSPRPPAELIDARQEPVHTNKGRLISATPIRTKREG